jgi:hypothetical protein
MTIKSIVFPSRPSCQNFPHLLPSLQLPLFSPKLSTYNKRTCCSKCFPPPLFLSLLCVSKHEMNAFRNPTLISPSLPPYSLATISLIDASFPIPNNLNTTSPKLSLLQSPHFFSLSSSASSLSSFIITIIYKNIKTV